MSPEQLGEHLSVSTNGDETVLGLAGSWRLPSLDRVHAALGRLETRRPDSARRVVLDGSGLEALDTAGALAMFTAARSCGASDLTTISLEGFDPADLRIAELVRGRLGRSRGEARPPRTLNPLQAIGRWAIRGTRSFVDLLSFLGESICGLVATFLRPWTFRLKEFTVQLERAGVDAVGVVSLVMLLIGVVLAYLFAAQIEKYGADIFIVDGVAIAVCRELSPVIVAIIVAGRSGSAFAAQIGAMKLNEEIDAMRVLGLLPLRVLVVPRIMALVVAMPLLVFLGDVIGISGGMIVAERYLGIASSTFVDRLRDTFPLEHLWVGLGKAPVFAMFIAVIGCKMGLSVENNTRSVGINTTSTVVQSIVSVILLNAAFAVILQELGI